MEKILIVDDSLVMRRMLRTELTKNSYEVVDAENGKEALERAAMTQPDLIISDINMPVMDGWEFCWQLRKNPHLNKIPFIFLSANNEVSDRVRGIQLGADDYIIKPFSPQELIARVQGLVLRYKREDPEEEQNRSLTGNLAKMSLPNLLQFLNMNSMSGVLEINYQDKKGQIFIKEGDIINSKVDQIQGKKALFRVLSWKEGRFIFGEDEPVGQVVFQENSLKLIMDCLKQLDELDKIRDNIPPEEAYIELEDSLLDDPEFNETMRGFFKTVKQEKRVKEILNSSGLSDFQIYQIIDLMVQEGLFKITL